MGRVGGGPSGSSAINQKQHINIAYRPASPYVLEHKVPRTRLVESLDPINSTADGIDQSHTRELGSGQESRGSDVVGPYP